MKDIRMLRKGSMLLSLNCNHRYYHVIHFCLLVMHCLIYIYKFECVCVCINLAEEYKFEFVQALTVSLHCRSPG